MSEASFSRRANYGRSEFARAPKPDNRIKYTIWAMYVFSLFGLLYLAVNMMKFWFLPSLMIGENAWYIFGFCTVLIGVLSYPHLGDIYDYFETRPEPMIKMGVQYGPLGNTIWHIVLAVLSALFLVCYLFPHASTYVTGETTVKTVNVEWKKKQFRSCPGYKLVDRPLMSNNMICGIPSDVAKRVGKSGTLTIQGVENALGFRPVKIVTSTAK